MYPFGAPEGQDARDLFNLIEGIKLELVADEIIKEEQSGDVSVEVVEDFIADGDQDEDLKEEEMAESPADPTGDGDEADDEEMAAEDEKTQIEERYAGKLEDQTIAQLIIEMKKAEASKKK